MRSSVYFSDNGSHNERQSGIGLIEILIAVLLISIGFLAAARMQVEGMRFSQSAYYQSQAYFMASDMIDRMRSNVSGVAAGHYTGESTSALAEDPQCDVNPCMPDALARQDVYDWSSSLHSVASADSGTSTTTGFVAALPGSTTTPASGQIEEVSDGVFAVIMSWNEVIGGVDTEETFRIQFALEEEQ